jgi:hypothetical protein
MNVDIGKILRQILFLRSFEVGEKVFDLAWEM